jgi:hypothetical protein
MHGCTEAVNVLRRLFIGNRKGGVLSATLQNVNYVSRVYILSTVSLTLNIIMRPFLERRPRHVLSRVLYECILDTINI